MKSPSDTSALMRYPWLPWVTLTVVVMIWLAPLTLLGQMPIGGDVTSFFLPLMSCYREALLQGRIPLWNELWGYGFPMLAESQAGVFYPPHLVLFHLFQVETAYSLNIVLHFLMASWFAYFCGRSFGLRRAGATLAGLVFAGSGFFVIQFPHQWSYITGCWLPLAVALAWRASRPVSGEGYVAMRDHATKCAFTYIDRLKAAIGLAVVLAVQMLAGHFQIAFYTQVVVLLISLLCTLQSVWRRMWQRRSQPAAAANVASRPKPTRRRIVEPWGSSASLFWIGVPVLGAFILSAVQLLPTRELIQIALPEGRQFEYLSGFANTPFHLVSYLLPTLFHLNPLWRPVAWDPFHTSPEECFSYVGLLPICLALGAAWRWRHEARVRLWITLALITLFLSFGPYMPGFRALIVLPGFSGFRSAARWSVTTALFCALLAGRGLDGVRSGARLKRWLGAFLVMFLVVAGCCAAFLDAILDLSRPVASHWLSAAETVRRLVSPWPGEPAVAEIVKRAGEIPKDAAVYGALARTGFRIRPDPKQGDMAQGIIIGSTVEYVRALSLSDQRRVILCGELIPPAVVMIFTLGTVVLCQRGRRTRPFVLLAVSALDLTALAWLRPVEFANRSRLVAASPVLGFLERELAGQRGIDDLRNLPMIAGTAPVQYYRTVDIPMLEAVNLLLLDPRFYGTARRDQLLERTDVRWILRAGSSQGWRLALPRQPGDVDLDFHDPLLARLVYGSSLSRQFPRSTGEFFVRRPAVSPQTRAWFVADGADAPEGFLTSNYGRPDRRPFLVDDFFAVPATPANLLRSGAESTEYELRAPAAGLVLLSELAYPGWEAMLSSGDSEMRTAVLPTVMRCRAVRIPAPGDYRLTLQFRSRAFEKGMLISLSASAVVAIAALGAMAWRGKPKR